ncbi:hypothetical protein D9M68_505140 [compost metagenome]
MSRCPHRGRLRYRGMQLGQALPHVCQCRVIQHAEINCFHPAEGLQPRAVCSLGFGRRTIGDEGRKSTHALDGIGRIGLLAEHAVRVGIEVRKWVIRVRRLLGESLGGAVKGLPQHISRSLQQGGDERGRLRSWFSSLRGGAVKPGLRQGHGEVRRLLGVEQLFRTRDGPVVHPALGSRRPLLCLVQASGQAFQGKRLGPRISF